jgi:hypothetical protein
MFYFCGAFKRDLGAWWPKALVSATYFLTGGDINTPNSASDQTNYNDTLIGWTGWSGGLPGAKGLALQNNVNIDFGNSKYSLANADAVAARAWLIGTKGWTISDGGGI